MVGKHFNCGACRFWQDQNIIGLCRRYPTHQNKHKHDWCGEWVSSEEPAIVALPVVEMPVENPVQKRKYTRRQDVNPSA